MSRTLARDGCVSPKRNPRSNRGRSTVVLRDSLGAMATPRERALRPLHRLLGRGPFGLRPRRYQGPDGEGQIAGTVGALAAAGLLSEDEAEAWRVRLGGAEELGTDNPELRERAA